MRSQLIKNALLVNEGRTVATDVRIKGDRIDSIASSLSATALDQLLDATGCYLMPGMIDDQVHYSRSLCGWTPVADQQFSARIVSTWVNGQQVFNGYHILEPTRAAMPLLFNR